MNQIKSIALTVVGTVVALTMFGFFASVGLALIGGLFVIGATVALAVWINSFFAAKQEPVDITT